MKLSFFFISIFLFYIIDAASLKNLSEKLSINDEFKNIKNDNTKEKVPNDELIVSKKYEKENESEVLELNKLKFNYEKTKLEKLEDLDENPEKSLGKLRNSSFKGSKFLNISKQKNIHKKYTSNFQTEDLKNSYSSNEIIKMSSDKISAMPRNESIINAYSLLSETNGKYSVYEIAQYIFWTGDEVGVANAVEELIDEGLMTRENAVELLKDIRLGINYLKNKYNRQESKNVLSKTQPKTTTSIPSIIDDIPFSYNFMKPHDYSTTKLNDKAEINNDNKILSMSPVVVQTLYEIPSLVKLAKIHKEKKNSYQTKESESNEEIGRLKSKDNLYGEYSLEDVIYQLAKTMFTQSLTNGSEDSQAALQKLTQFLENEGKHGRISPILEKKVLDVLLAALSETLSENPEILKNTHLATDE